MTNITIAILIVAAIGVLALASLLHFAADEFRKLRRRTNHVANMLDDLLQIKYKAHDTQREMLRAFYNHAEND